MPDLTASKRPPGSSGSARRLPGAALTALLASGCARPLNEQECTALLDRYVVRLVASDRPEASALEREAARLKTRRLAERDPAFPDCSRQVSRRQFECAMAAGDVDAMERCLL